MWAPLALAVVVAGVIVAVMLTVGGGAGSGRPALLRLADSGGGGALAAEPATGDDVAPGASPFVLDGTLPAGQPADQPVWHLRTPTADDAAGVADALGLDGAMTRIRDGWVLRDGRSRLLVRDDGGWSYGLDCYADQPLEDERADVMCAAAGGVAVAAPPRDTPTMRPGPSASDARADAAPVLQALGLSDARVTVSEGTPTTTVAASYDVDGTPTAGFTTTLSFTTDDALATGDGWLPDVSRGDDYPVITAQAAFDLLKQQPRPMIEMCLRRQDGKPGCAPIRPTVITGANLGLTLAQDNGRPTVVPAWLFTVKDQTEPLVQVAVDPAFIAPPRHVVDEPPVTSVPPDGGASEPGYPGPPDTKPTVTPEGASPA